MALREYIGRAPVPSFDSRGPVAQRAYRGAKVDGAVDTIQVVFDAYVASPAGTAVLAIVILRRLIRRRCAPVLLLDAKDGCRRGMPRRSLMIHWRRWGVRRVRLVSHRPQRVGTHARLGSFPGELPMCIVVLAVAPQGRLGVQRGCQG